MKLDTGERRFSNRGSRGKLFQVWIIINLEKLQEKGHEINSRILPPGSLLKVIFRFTILHRSSDKTHNIIRIYTLSRIYAIIVSISSQPRSSTAARTAASTVGVSQ